MKSFFALTLLLLSQNVSSYSFEDLDLKRINVGYYRENVIPRTPVIDDYYGDLFMPYLFNSGVGNRERAVVHDIGVDESFPFGDDVIDWNTLTFGGRQYLVGKRDHKVVLIQVKIKLRSSDKFNTLYFNKTFMKFEGTVGPIALTTRMNRTSGLEEGFALVTESNRDHHQCIHWLKLTNRGLVLYDTWWNPTRGEIIDLKWIKFDFIEYLLIVTRSGNGSTTIDLSEYKAEDNKIRLMCKDRMKADARVSSIASVVQGEDLYLALATPKNHRVELYRYHFNPLQTGDFQHISYIPGANVSNVKSFVQSGLKYFLTNGDEPNIYLLNQDETLTPQLNDCGSVQEWLILEVASYRQDVILLARDKSKVSILTWGGSEKGFMVASQPPCYSLLSSMDKQHRIGDDGGCLTRCKWSEGTALNLGDVPSLILACKGQDGIPHRGLYHFNVSLHPVHGPAQDIMDVLLTSRRLQTEVTGLSQEFEAEGLMEEITVSRRRLEEGWTGEWNGLEHCLTELDQQVRLMSSYMEMRRHNNISVSLSLHQGKLQGSASGLLANKTVETTFKGKMKLKPNGGANDWTIVVDSEVLLDRTKYYSLKAEVNLVLTELPPDEQMRSDTSYSNRITPEVRGPDGFKVKQVEEPLHRIMANQVYGSN